MARDFWDGFDTYASSGQMGAQWAMIGGTASFAAGRFGGQCVTLGTTTGNESIGRNVSVAGTSTYTFGVAVRCLDQTRPPLCGMGFYNTSGVPNNTSSNRQVGFTIEPAGALVILRGSSTELYRTADGFIPNNTWMYIGLSAVIAAGTGGKFALSVNGMQVVEQTGINTQGASDLLIKYVSGGLGNISSPGDIQFDDFYTDTAYFQIPPERRVETLYASADGSHLDLTPSTGATHFGVVDEAQASTADYLSGSTVGHYDELELTNLGNTPTTIDGVKAAGFASKTDAATRAVNYGIRSNGSDALGSDITLAATSLQGFNNVLLNPDGSVAWNAAAVNAMKFLARIAV